jgi:hypothetical protein
MARGQQNRTMTWIMFLPGIWTLTGELILCHAGFSKLQISSEAEMPNLLWCPQIRFAKGKAWARFGLTCSLVGSKLGSHIGHSNGATTLPRMQRLCA